MQKLCYRYRGELHITYEPHLLHPHQFRVPPRRRFYRSLNVSHLQIFRCTFGHQGLGYAGISNMLAVEFDTHYNAEMLEPYENHVSVQTRCGQLIFLAPEVLGSVTYEGEICTTSSLRRGLCRSPLRVFRFYSSGGHGVSEESVRPRPSVGKEAGGGFSLLPVSIPGISLWLCLTTFVIPRVSYCS